MWKYRELISCPMPILLGSFKYEGLVGYASIFSMNHRLNILIGQNNEVRLVSNIANKAWLDHLANICLSIYNGKIGELDDIDKALAYSMHYGGFVLTGFFNNNTYLVSTDYVGKGKFSFYIIERDTISKDTMNRATLGDWIAFQLALREGIMELLVNICKRSFTYRDGACILSTSHGELIITLDKIFPMGTRILPDNNPFRHVISVYS